MDMQEFNALPLNERTASVWKLGTFLSSRTKGNYSLALYHIGSFFSEMWYDPVENKIMLVQAFTSRTLPEPYLELIELPRL
ncbi:hypothetical protein [Pontibacter pamirensis]|uniref:hypothetical protein n=1 Tax=Pontibacter pamirensis TaxID=2562824 RepID=UPI001389A94C|nr:hypothetical protein [Pontibacter pamirensis]